MPVLARLGRRRGAIAAVTGAVMLAAPLAAVAQSPVAAAAARPAVKPATSVYPAPVFTPQMRMLGTVNLSTLGPPPATRAPGAVTPRPADQRVVTHRPAGQATTAPSSPLTPVTNSQVPGEYGFVGLTGVQQATANGGLDLEPPDQGLCAGDGYVTEFVNNALTVYQPNGNQVLPVIPSYEVFKQPSTDFFSDPRCYYDSATGHWFLTEFIVGTVGANGQATSPSVQFLAVSDTTDPTGSYHLWAFNTTDAGHAGCPCFGDYDNLGADSNGIYITTDEFPIANAGYNGVVMYALSKETIESYPNSGIAPTVFAYRLPKDYFGQPYIVAPTTTPQGAKFAPNTEYFVESNGNALSDSRLAVYALNDTSLLAQPAPPTLYITDVNSEPYAFPPDATQKAGPIPLGNSVQDPEGQLQADFDSVMEPTYLNGNVYGQLDTATKSGSDAVDWFQLTPTLSGQTLSATMARQGYVTANGANLLYPYTALSSNGNGYMLFSLAGPNNYPSAAYISYGPNGPSGPVRIAGAGALPEDGFTCYAAYVGPNYGGCRWGDYSMGAASGGRVYMSTEMIPGTSRDTLTNWGTYVWSAPAGS